MADLALAIQISGVDEASPAFTKAAAGLGQVESAAAKAGGAMGGFGASLGNVAQMIAGFAIGGVLFSALASIPEKMNAVVTSTTDLGNATYTLRNIIGGTTQDASALLAVFERYGVNVDQATVALGIFDRHLAGIADTTSGVLAGTKPFDQSMRDLGVAFTDASGAALPMNDVLLSVADKFAQLGPGADRTAIAMQLFGRSGRDLIPILSLGRDGMLEAEQAAAKYGLTLTGANVDAVRSYTLAHKDLDEAMQGVTLSIGTMLMPVLTSAAQGIASDAQAMNQTLIPAINVGATRISRDADIIALAYGKIHQAQFGHAVTSPAFQSAAEGAAARFERLAAQEVLAGLVNYTFVGSLVQVQRSIDQLGVALDYAGSKELQVASATMTLREEMGPLSAVTDGATAAVNNMSSAMGASEMAIDKFGQKIVDQQAAIAGAYKLQQAASDAVKLSIVDQVGQLMGINTNPGAFDAARAYAPIDELNKKNAALAASLAKEEAAARSASAATAGIGQSALVAVAGLSALDMQIAGTQSQLAGVQLQIEEKVLARMERRPVVNIYQEEVLLQEQLKIEQLQKAAGFDVPIEANKISNAQARAARSASRRLPHLQAGGSFDVGGTGGPDSQYIDFMASPGENVSVSPPGAMSGSNGAGSVIIQNLIGAGAIIVQTAADADHVGQLVAAHLRGLITGASGAVGRANRQLAGVR